MRKIHVTDPIIDQLITGSNQVIHNILYRIREGADASVWTDDKSYIVAQSNPNTPLWVALLTKPEAEACAQVVNVMLSRLADRPDTRVTISAELGAEVVAQVEQALKRRAQWIMPMVAYGCFATRDVPMRGHATMPAEEDVASMAELLRQNSMDAEGVEVSMEDALAYAHGKVGSDRLFLWKDGSVVSMAGIAHVNEQYARIAPVVTERGMRGRGYAPMLVKTMADALLARGVTPMLYADARNPSSNRAYQKIGFEKQGEVTTYAFPAL